MSFQKKILELEETFLPLVSDNKLRDKNNNSLSKSKSFALVPRVPKDWGLTKNMPKKFNFKPQPTSTVTSNRPHLSVTSVPSVHAPTKKESNWFDDDIDDMLVQASQMVEARIEPDGQPERMEMDAEALNKFMTEEDKSGNNDDDWDAPMLSQRMIQQTQTVFQAVIFLECC